MYESSDKLVSHPGHYQSRSGLEVIDVIEAFTDGLEGIEAVDTGNAIKYICRWKKKNGVQDLEKAIWYLQHLVDHLKATPDPKADVDQDGQLITLKCCCTGCSNVFEIREHDIKYDPFRVRLLLLEHLRVFHGMDANSMSLEDIINNFYEKEIVK